MALADLTVHIGADLSDLNKGLADANTGVQRFGNSVSANITAPIRSSTVAAESHHLALSKVTRALEGLGAEAIGVNSKVGTLAATFLEFGAGGPLTVGILAGFALIGVAWEKLTEKSRDTKKATEEAIKELEQLRDKQLLGSLAGTSARAAEKAGIELASVQDELDSKRELLAAQRSVGGSSAGSETEKQIFELEERQKDLRSLVAAHELAVTEVRKEAADKRAKIAKEESDKAIAEAKRLFDARRALDDLTSNLIEKKFGVDKEPPKVSTVASEGLARGAAGDSIAGLKIPDSVFANVVAVHDRAAGKIYEAGVRLVVSADELHKAAIKNLAVGELTSLLSEHGGAIGGIASGAISGALAAGPIGALIGGGGALISTLLSHRKSVNDNTTALNRLTERLINSPAGFNLDRYHFGDPVSTTRTLRNYAVEASNYGGGSFFNG